MYNFNNNGSETEKQVALKLLIEEAKHVGR